MTDFLLFGDSYDDDTGYGTTTLGELLERIPDDVPTSQVRLSYAGCGTHDVLVDWGLKSEPEPKIDAEPAPSHPSLAEPPLPEPVDLEQLAWRAAHPEDIGW